MHTESLLDIPAPRLIASDIDGTFLDRNHRVPPRNRDAVVRAVAAGAHFALSTGRPYRWIAPVVEQLPLRPLCVTSNGAVIYDAHRDQVVRSTELSAPVLAQVVAAAHEAMASHGGIAIGVERAGTSSLDPVEELYVVDPLYSENAMFDGFGVAPTAEVVAQPAVKLLLRNTQLSAPQLYDLISPHIDPQLAHVTYSMDAGILEVAAPGVTKAAGVEWLARHYGVEQHRTIAFGDMPNDVEMLQWAGLGVAMDNAAPQVKEAADYVAPPNHAAGVAAVLERWF
ncbi:HAD family hydrolase [Corynebacterium lizhenjunii]|uniref:HAD family hydrolase n=1 Tax=Corynebacterium lizhenjunii TaxID=2709394 RepID=A0A7T0P9P2_9CORY|nr:HAD family hydrolase [Corynebacterium lizhenjunii]QPK79018.1 HAD family hydrolase [Corynebacterium lizhenjunii]